MASCDDDFTIIGDENQNPHHHHHHHPHHSLEPHSFALKPQPPPPLNQQPHPLESLKNPGGPTSGVNEDGDDDYSDAGFASHNNTKCPQPFHPFSDDPEADPDPFDDSNPKRTNSRPDKRKDQQHDELSDGGTSFYYKKPKPGANSITGTCDDVEYRIEFRPDYRKDREEWSDTAIGSLLDAYTEKYVQLNRGNLRGRDWEEVATIVSSRCNKQKPCKSVEQCKNKVDNLKKRYKVERHRMQNFGITVSHWPWFKKIEQIVNNSATSKSVSDEDKSGSGSVNLLRPMKRYSIPIASPVGLANNTKTKSLANPRWRRVVFKISGAALAGSGPQNIDPKVAMLIAREVLVACRLSVEVAIVVGGRNFFCGDSWMAATGVDRSTTYQIGMMATVMNSILLQSALEKLGVQTRVQTAFPMQEVAEPYNKRRAIRHLEKGRVVIFGGVGAGTGNPPFTTDTASALRAAERMTTAQSQIFHQSLSHAITYLSVIWSLIHLFCMILLTFHLSSLFMTVNADAVVKGTNVDGIYDCHSRNNGSVPFDHLSFRELVSRGVTSVDMTALTFCEESGIPVVVFNLLEPGNISRALCGQQVGTLIDQAGRSN